MAKNFADVILQFNLNYLYKLIFAKRCMAGKETLLIQSASKVNSWEKL